MTCMVAATVWLMLVHEFYDKKCCEDQHCHPVPCAEIKTTPFGWQWHGLQFDRTKLISSPDGHCHVCNNATQPYCIYLPFAGET